MKVVPSLAVICALSGPAVSSAAPQRTGEGRMVAQRAGKAIASHGSAGARSTPGGSAESIDLPLEHTDVRIRVDGPIADATVTQRFRNPGAARVDAVYAFPLPAGAAVTDLRITIGARTIRGAIAERPTAPAIYAPASGRGLLAALLEAQPSLFTQPVAGVEPSAGIEVVVRYVQRVDTEGQRHELVFPLVAGPGPSVVTGEPPATRSAHDVALRVELDAGVPITDLASPSHPLAVTRSGRRATVELAPGDALPNRDFVLRYHVGGAALEFGTLAARDGGAGSLLFIAQPPAVAEPAAIAPRELVLVLDTSSSMRGAPLDQARRLIVKLLLSLRPDDTYQILRLADRASALGPALIASKPSNLAPTLRWMSALEAGDARGAAGLGAALALPHDPARLRIVVLLTDGNLGRDDAVLARTAAQLGAARLYAFGIGSAVNRALLEDLTALGRGALQVVRPDENAGAAIAAFQRRIDAPVLTDVRIDWGDLPVRDLPTAIPDLFAGQPVILAGHYDRAARGTATVRGKRGGRDVQLEVAVALPERDAARPAIASLWARQRIAELSRRAGHQAAPGVEREIRQIALEHHVLTPTTAFVTVDDARPSAGSVAARTVVPVEVPAFVRAIAARSDPEAAAFAGGGYPSGPYGSPSMYVPLSARHVATAPIVRIGVRPAWPGSLEKGIVRRYVQRQLNAVRYCYEKVLLRRPRLAGTVNVHFLVAPDGRVVQSTADGLGDPEVERCIAGVIAAIEFPAVPDGATTAINYPFTLVPSVVPAETEAEELP